MHHVGTALAHELRHGTGFEHEPMGLRMALAHQLLSSFDQSLSAEFVAMANEFPDNRV